MRAVLQNAEAEALLHDRFHANAALHGGGLGLGKGRFHLPLVLGQTLAVVELALPLVQRVEDVQAAHVAWEAVDEAALVALGTDALED
jgi:hypothetical protein